MNPKERERIERKAEKKQLSQIQCHVFFCGQSGCCKSPIEAKEAWKTLGKAIKSLEAEGIVVARAEVECFSLCAAGPIIAVYPDGVWYGRVTPEAMERIIEEHLRGGRVVEELVFARKTSNTEGGP